MNKYIRIKIRPYSTKKKKSTITNPQNFIKPNFFSRLHTIKKKKINKSFISIIDTITTCR